MEVNYVFLFIFLALGLVGLFLLFFLNIRFCRQRLQDATSINKFYKTLGLVIMGTAIVFTAMLLLVFSVMPEEKTLGERLIHKEPYEWILIVFGTIFFLVGFGFALSGFILHYFHKGIDPEVKKRIRLVYYFGFVLMIVGLIILLEGFARHLDYPLISGIAINGDGIQFVTANNMYGSDFKIMLYAVCILAGAALSYIISDHKMYQLYGKHGMLDTTALVAIPSGIIGARLWFCLVEGQMDRFFLFWDGGLAVYGGVLGVVVGALWFLVTKRKQNLSLLKVADFVIPTILLAQALGRWGNFFNHEVYGFPVETADWWFLPTFIKNQMYVPGKPTQMFLPLFLIESLLDIAGYVLIIQVYRRFFSGTKAHKYNSSATAYEKFRHLWRDGDGSALYSVWYGTIRLSLEGLREPEFIMAGDWQIPINMVVSIIMLSGGTLSFIGRRFLKWFFDKRKTKLNSLLKYKNIILDFDGTLVNSDVMLLNTLNVMLSIYRPGTRFEPADIVKYSGPPIENTLESIFPDVDKTELMSRYASISRARDEDVILYPNALKALKLMKNSGAKLVVFSSKQKASLVRQLHKLGILKYFDLVVGLDDTPKAKPDPSGLDLIIEKLGALKEDTLFVGDSLYDYEAAQNAHIDVLMCGWSPRLNPQMRQGMIMNDYAELTSYVRKSL